MSDKKENKKKLSENIIIICITLIIGFIQSFLTLLSFLWKGVKKKEVLSNKTDFGFDVEIIVKD